MSGTNGPRQVGFGTNTFPDSYVPMALPGQLLMLLLLLASSCVLCSVCKQSGVQSREC